MWKQKQNENITGHEQHENSWGGRWTENNFENEFSYEYFWCSWANDRNEEEVYEFLTWKLKICKVISDNENYLWNWDMQMFVSISLSKTLVVFKIYPHIIT